MSAYARNRGINMQLISQHYIDGIKEGRLFNREYHNRKLLEDEIKRQKSLRERVARLAGSKGEIDFVDGQIAFYENQRKKFI